MSFRAFYGDVWANFWTPSVWTILAIVVSHMLHRKSIATHMDKLRDHITRTHRGTADAQASGGAGSNPADQGLAADQRVAPPPAAPRPPRYIRVEGLPETQRKRGGGRM